MSESEVGLIKQNTRVFIISPIKLYASVKLKVHKYILRTLTSVPPVQDHSNKLFKSFWSPLISINLPTINYLAQRNWSFRLLTKPTSDLNARGSVSMLILAMKRMDLMPGLQSSILLFSMFSNTMVHWVVTRIQ